MPIQNTDCWVNDILDDSNFTSERKPKTLGIMSYICPREINQSLIVHYRRTVNSFFIVPVIIIPK